MDPSNQYFDNPWKPAIKRNRISQNLQTGMVIYCFIRHTLLQMILVQGGMVRTKVNR